MTEENYKITTKEAIMLIQMMKEIETKQKLNFPLKGEKLQFNVYAKKYNTKFIVNITRSSINKGKCTYQGRTYIKNIPLLRLDITGSTHMNTDGTKIVGNHLHIYNEKTQLKEAIPFDVKRKDLYEYCLEFFKIFNIIKQTNFNQKGGKEE